MIASKRGIQEISREANIPMNVTLELLTECNLQCIHCYIPKHTEKGLDDHLLVELLRELREMGALYLARVSSSGVNSAEGFWGIDETAAM